MCLFYSRTVQPKVLVTLRVPQLHSSADSIKSRVEGRNRPPLQNLHIGVSHVALPWKGLLRISLFFEFLSRLVDLTMGNPKIKFRPGGIVNLVSQLAGFDFEVLDIH
jgi:hypothetical protein